MRLLWINLLLTISWFQYSFEASQRDATCPQLNRSLEFADFSFPHKAIWQIYAFSDPGMATRSLFSVHEDKIDLKMNCLKFSSTSKNLMSHQCTFRKSMMVLDITKIFLNVSMQESYYKRLFNNVKPFADLSILDTDQESFITFYGCQQIVGYASEGILILIKSEEFENFNESKLERSFELLRNSFGFKIVDQMEDSPIQGKCSCYELYQANLADAKKHKDKLHERKGLISAYNTVKTMSTTKVKSKQSDLFLIILFTGVAVLIFVFIITVHCITSGEK